MESPFILSSWLSTKITGLNWSGKWNKSVADGRAILTTLQVSGLLREGQYIMYCKTSSFVKLTPAEIQEDPDKLTNLQSFGITIDEYATAYSKMVLPSRTKLSSEGIAYICPSKNFVPYYHLYHQKEIINKFDKLIEDGKIKSMNGDDGITRYVISDLVDNPSDMCSQSSNEVGDIVSLYDNRPGRATTSSIYFCRKDSADRCGKTTFPSNIHNLSNEEINENQQATSSPNREDHQMKMKRKNVFEEIDNKRRKDDGNYLHSHDFFLLKMSDYLMKKALIITAYGFA
ncbi:unnamed protein product [Rotaria sp. Silwood1]|nr:unnamed protein product [Rotaria sp. Silwood1]CAF4925448.1 unnamed protein product [Rotaria sp. Silwood1]